MQLVNKDVNKPISDFEMRCFSELQQCQDIYDFDQIAGATTEEILGRIAGSNKELVYVVTEEGKSAPVKIGKCTANLYGRLSQLNTGNPRKLSVVMCFCFGSLEGSQSYKSSASKAEKFCHTRFAKKQVRGEWYEIGAEEILSAVEDFSRANNCDYVCRWRENG